MIASQARSVISAAEAYSQEIREAARGDARVVLADAIEDARRIRLRIDALADAATELLRDVRREADRLTAELGFEPELLQGVVELEAGAEETPPAAQTEAVEEGTPTAVHERPRQTVTAEPVVEETEGDDLSLDEKPASGSSGRSDSAEPIDLDEDESADDAKKPAEADESTAAEAKPEAEKSESAQETKVDDAVVIDDDDGKADSKGDPIPCKACDTTGQCSNCKGKGRRARFFRCGECGGSGRCSVCGGPGYVWADKS